MPVLRRMTDDEVSSLNRNNGAGGVRKSIEAEYDSYVADYQIGEYAVVELTEDEVKQKTTIRNRLEAAAKRRGLTLNFIRTRGSVLRFKVEQTAEESVLDLFGKPEPVEA